jgi:anti-sigma B factor antagonist
MALNVSRNVISDVLVLQVQGVGSGVEAATRFRDAARQGLDEGHRKIVLDFAQLTYQDSMFLGTLVETYAALKNMKGNLAIVNVSQRTMDLFKVTRLESCFQFFDTLSEGLEHFGAPQSRTATPTPEK